MALISVDVTEEFQGQGFFAGHGHGLGLGEAVTEVTLGEVEFALHSVYVAEGDVGEALAVGPVAFDADLEGFFEKLFGFCEIAQFVVDDALVKGQNSFFLFKSRELKITSALENQSRAFWYFPRNRK